MPVRVRFKVNNLDKLNERLILSMMSAVTGHIAAKGDEYFQDTHATFSPQNQPARLFRERRYRKSVRFQVGRTGEVYTLLHLGSPEHEITPVAAEQMVFYEGYRSATQPGVLKATKSSYFGPRVARKFVEHPGFKGRQFDLLVLDETSKYIFQNFNKIQDVAQGIIDAYL